MRVCTVIGTRPEIIKMAPLIPLLDERFEHTFLFTSQHYSRNMVEIFLEEMDVRRPDRFLGVDSSDHAALEAALVKPLADARPDVILVYGDTNSTVACARAKPAGAKLIHLEAGIRSFDLRMPEEHNRIETDRLADWRLAPSGLAKYFLVDLEGYDPATCPVVGNLVVDAYRRYQPKIEAEPLLDGLTPGAFCVLTMHRAENVDEPVRLKALLESLAGVNMPIIFPVHPRTEKRMLEFGLSFPKNLRTLEPVGYLQFMKLMTQASVIVTDSGGIQEEALTIGTPCVTLRDNTERMETVFLGANVLYDGDHRRDLGNVVTEMVKRRDMIAALKNPYGDGHTSEKVVALLADEIEAAMSR
jgi:UDP-N-acetylglucosamine 2-epimerase